MTVESINIDLGSGKSLHIETGKLALLCNGSVTLRQGDSSVLVCAVSSQPRPGIDFFPLQVEYRERFAAAGRIPGSFFRREGRPSEKEILTARMTDRPLRPLFPQGFINEVQIVSTLLSSDGENEPDVLSILGASVALMVSDIPFNGPVGALRVGRINGEFVANPTHSEMKQSDLDLVYAGISGKVIMIEGKAEELSEEVLRDALSFADQIVQKQIEAQKELAARVNKAKFDYVPSLPQADLLEACAEFCGERLQLACSAPAKLQRQEQQDQLFSEMCEAMKDKFTAEDGSEPDFKLVWETLLEKTIRSLVLDKKQRQDGRRLDELRQVNCEVGLLPRTHGSALFNRGDTQALVTCTLGSSDFAQEFDAVTGGEKKKQFMLHYNFPNFSTGETGRYGSTNRRETGHGSLAERSMLAVLPKDFPYTIRLTSEILGSNGSSSMASVCGASLALMDAGLPVSDAVVGISIGMVSDETRREFLTDILGSEDHYGDMDFKVSATSKGITGFQLDLKVAGIDVEGMYQAMLLNKKAREEIRGVMSQCLAEPRPELSPYAPQMQLIKINPDKIGALIGPGGKNIRGIQDETGAQISVDDDGSVRIFTSDAKDMERARYLVESCTGEVEVGKIYQGLVKSVKEFGAFVEILPGQEGMVHISELADYRVKNVEEICRVGDEITVKVINIDDRGRVRLSRKAALAEL